jgi:hypothetical protein
MYKQLLLRRREHEMEGGLWVAWTRCERVECVNGDIEHHEQVVTGN